jgi:membrane protein EpsK
MLVFTENFEDMGSESSNFSRSSIDAGRQIGPNLIASIVSFAIRMGGAIWFVPYLVRNLGAAAYGLVPLAVTVTSYMTIVTTSISSAVSRDMTLAFACDDRPRCSQVFNTALFGLLAIVCGLAIVSIGLTLNVEKILTIPFGLESVTRNLFALVCAAFLLTTIVSPFGASAIAMHRLDLLNGVSIVETVVRMATVVLTFNILNPQLDFVGIGVLTGAVFAASGNVLLWKRLTPQISIQLRDFRFDVLRRFLATGAWVVVGHLGTLLLLSIDLILVNKIFGAEQSGRYALVLQWAMILRMLSSVIAGTFTPTITAVFATNDSAKILFTLRASTKFVGVIMAIPIGIICGYGHPLLGLWLGSEYTDLAPLLTFLVAPLILSVPLTPIFALALAAERVRTFGLVTLGMGMAVPPLALIFVNVCDLELYGVAVAGGTLLAARSLFFDTQFVSGIIGRNSSIILSDLHKSSIFCLLIAVASKWVSYHVIIDSWNEFILYTALTSVVGLGSAYRFFLSKSERKDLGVVIRNLDPRSKMRF